MAEAEGVDIRIYNIIYNIIEDVQKALTGLLEPVYKEVITGHAEIRPSSRSRRSARSPAAWCSTAKSPATRPFA